MQKITTYKAKQFQTLLRPLFPGYLVIQLDPLAGYWRKINNTRGVSRLVQFGTNSCPVPDMVIAFTDAAMQTMCCKTRGH
jgi:transcriptional antiterminator RfaH